MRSLDEHRDLIEDYLARLSFSDELHGLTDAMRYSLAGGGKRIRPVLCLATTEAAGGGAEDALPAAAAIELVHSFSLVHDDLPALDDDALRRGRPSTHVEHGEAVAILAGDALLAQAFALAGSYRSTAVVRELAGATLGMIGGQFLDVSNAVIELRTLHALKTGRLFAAAVGCGLWVADVPEPAQRPWRAFAEELGLLFQIGDDLADGDGLVAESGEEAARRAGTDAEDRVRARLDEIDADTSKLDELVSALSNRVRAS